MKHINNFNEYLILERKNYSNLYHFTSLINLINILWDNGLGGSDSDYNTKQIKDRFVISFTRDKNFYKEHPEFSKSAIVLDGETLTDNYKIKPHNFFYFDNKDTKKDKNYESEELLILKKGEDSLHNVKKYIIRIIVPKFEDFYEHYLEYMEGVDYDTQFERVVEIYNRIEKENPITDIDSLSDDKIHEEFLLKVYKLIVDEILDMGIDVEYIN